MIWLRTTPIAVAIDTGVSVPRLMALVLLTLRAALACVAITGLTAHAQQPAKMWRIGVLLGGDRNADNVGRSVDAFQRGLRELGYVEGQNTAIEWRFSGSDYSSLPALAMELARSDVSVVVSGPDAATHAMKQANAPMPVVMAASGDPGSIVKNLARPEANITGISRNTAEIGVKYLDLLRVAIPKLGRVAVVSNPDNPNNRVVVEQIHKAAAKSGVAVSHCGAKSPAAVIDCYATLMRTRPGALIVPGDPVVDGQNDAINHLAAKSRLPVMYSTPAPVTRGGLMGYGITPQETWYRAATYVDKILKGARPSDLPVEMPTKIELVLNLKTAKVIGLDVPKELLLRADRVIQ
jgi:putative tryptophan/tyrosine transport system substrate-binding protein